MAPRILMTSTPIGGVWTYGKELTIELLRRGASVAMALFGREPSDAQRDWLLQTEREHRFVWATGDAPLEGADDNAAALSGGVEFLQNMARDFDADVLLSNQYCWGALELFRDTAGTRRVPRVVVAHSDVFTWEQACHRPAPEDSPWLRRYVQLVSDGLRGADAVVAPSRAYLRDVSRFFALPQNSRAVHCWRTLATTAPDAGVRKLQAITAGRLWDPAKNLGVLRGVDLEMPVLIAGEQSHDGMSFAGDAGAATLIGPLEEGPLLNMFRESAVYICTSQYEPFGLAPVEAALCGCAVLCFDIPTLREVWGDDAIFFADGRELAQKLRVLANSPEKLAELQRRSQARALRYNSKDLGDEWMRVLGSVAI